MSTDLDAYREKSGKFSMFRQMVDRIWQTHTEEELKNLFCLLYCAVGLGGEIGELMFS